MTIEQLRDLSTTIILAGLILTTFIVPAVAGDSNDPKTLNIEITTHLGDQQTFRKGDQISFLITLDRDAYLLMIYEDANHNLVQVIPNRHRNNNYYEAGLFIGVPYRDAPFRFVVEPPFGRETLWVFAADKPFPTLPGITLENGLRKLSEGLTVIQTRLRNRASTALYGEAKTTIITEPGS